MSVERTPRNFVNTPRMLNTIKADTPAETFRALDEFALPGDTILIDKDVYKQFDQFTIKDWKMDLNNIYEESLQKTNHQSKLMSATTLIKSKMLSFRKKFFPNVDRSPLVLSSNKE